MRTLEDTVKIDTDRVDDDHWLLAHDLCIVAQEHPGVYTDRSIRYRLENEFYRDGGPETMARFRADALRSAFLIDHPRAHEIYELATRLCPNSLGGIAAILEQMGRIIHG